MTPSREFDISGDDESILRRERTKSNNYGEHSSDQKAHNTTLNIPTHPT